MDVVGVILIVGGSVLFSWGFQRLFKDKGIVIREEYETESEEIDSIEYEEDEDTEDYSDEI